MPGRSMSTPNSAGPTHREHPEDHIRLRTLFETYDHCSHESRCSKELLDGTLGYEYTLLRVLSHLEIDEVGLEDAKRDEPIEKHFLYL